ncbi:MAG: hypothetical protein M1820_005423 [Bogoriella megaspora]|nr:MAG: hypothetical protein M1820_005423 [Bogoriella megaspora]
MAYNQTYGGIPGQGYTPDPNRSQPSNSAADGGMFGYEYNPVATSAADDFDFLAFRNLLLRHLVSEDMRHLEVRPLATASDQLCEMEKNFLSSSSIANAGMFEQECDPAAINSAKALVANVYYTGHLRREPAAEFSRHLNTILELQRSTSTPNGPSIHGPDPTFDPLTYSSIYYYFETAFSHFPLPSGLVAHLFSDLRYDRGPGLGPVIPQISGPILNCATRGLFRAENALRGTTSANAGPTPAYSGPKPGDGTGGESEPVEGKQELVEGKLGAVEGKPGAVEGKLEAVEDKSEAVEDVEGKLEAVEGKPEPVKSKLERLESKSRHIESTSRHSGGTSGHDGNTSEGSEGCWKRIWAWWNQIGHGESFIETRKASFETLKLPTWTYINLIVSVDVNYAASATALAVGNQPDQMGNS